MMDFDEKTFPTQFDKKIDSKLLQDLIDVANKLRIHSITSTNAAGSGHPTSCASIAEIMAVLFFHSMKFDVFLPRDKHNDRFILSKGHAAPILYAAWAEAGLIPIPSLQRLRKGDSDLEGHPTPRLSFVDMATGSLGQGLSVACGMAYVGKYYDKASYKVFCLLGDGECAEGSVWEALSFAGVKGLNNLIAIIDCNRLGQSDPTAFEHDVALYKSRVESFGFNAYCIDGHDITELCNVFHEATQSTTKPTAIIARTYKGRGFPGIEDQLNWHGKPIGAATVDCLRTIKNLISTREPTALLPGVPIKDAPDVSIANVALSTPPKYKKGEKVATRFAFGTALAKLAENNSRVLALDGDTKNSTYSNSIQKVDKQRHIECYIAEQNLVGVGIGAACRDRMIVFCSTFAAFFTRAFDQLRIGAISETNINCVGSHAGISIGEDGPSQMALEDLAMFRALPGSTVFYPSDAVSTERACELAANKKGICFIRTSRPALSVLYNNDETFEIGKAHILRRTEGDKVLFIGACITIDEAFKADDVLTEQEGLHIRIMDPFTIKPIDKEAIIKNARECGGRIVVAEDHYPEGGIGEAVMAAVALERDIIVKHLAVPRVPRSGTCLELLELFGISAAAIMRASRELLKI